MKTIIILVAFTFLAGCQSSRPIKTKVELQIDKATVFSYSSEKDFFYSRTVTDPKTGIIEKIEVRADASSASYAQAERDKIREQASADRAIALKDSVAALVNLAARTANPLPANPLPN